MLEGGWDALTPPEAELLGGPTGSGPDHDACLLRAGNRDDDLEAGIEGAKTLKGNVLRGATSHSGRNAENFQFQWILKQNCPRVVWCRMRRHARTPGGGVTPSALTLSHAPRDALTPKCQTLTPKPKPQPPNPEPQTSKPKP